MPEYESALTNLEPPVRFLDGGDKKVFVVYEELRRGLEESVRAAERFHRHRYQQNEPRFEDSLEALGDLERSLSQVHGAIREIRHLTSAEQPGKHG